MPTNSTLNIPADTITLITSSDITAARIQNQCGYPITLLATVGATPPNNTEGGFILLPWSAISADITLAEIFPGVVGANRLHVICNEPAVISISHA